MTESNNEKNEQYRWSPLASWSSLADQTLNKDKD